MDSITLRIYTLWFYLALSVIENFNRYPKKQTSGYGLFTNGCVDYVVRNTSNTLCVQK